jgi:hypothetical protein
MIYREGIRLEREDLQEHIEILQEKFPTYFRKENPLPVKIDFIRAAKFEIDTFRPGGDVSAGRILKRPQPMGIKPIGYENDRGFLSEIRYSDSAPIARNGELKWNNSKMQLSEKTVLQPVVDLEKLIFLWFYCDHFTNNDCIKKRGSAKLEFIIPEQQVESKYDNIKSRRRLEDEILIEETRISYDLVKEVASKMGISLRGEEKVDRVTLFDRLAASSNNVKTYDSLKAQYKPEVGTTVEAVVGLTQIKNLVASAVENLKLFEDESVNKWRIKAPGKPKYLCDIEGESNEEKLFNLVEFVSNDLEALKTVQGLLK